MQNTVLNLNQWLLPISALAPKALVLATAIVLTGHAQELYTHTLAAPIAPSTQSGELLKKQPAIKSTAKHLMGSGHDKNTVNLKQIPPTKLKLILSGLFANSIEDKSWALIANEKSAAKRYNLGDKLPGGATLASIHSDYLVINRSGKMEKLHFPKAISTATTKATGNKPKNKIRPASAPRKQSKTNQNSSTDSIQSRLKQLRSNKNNR